jgi:hypothetical protein
MGAVRRASIEPKTVMIARLVLFALSVMLVVFPSALAVTDFEYGPRPPFSVFDPEGTLKPDVLGKLSEQLSVYRQKEGIDVIVIVLKDIGEAPPEHVASTFAQAWCTSPLHCVVLHVPGREDSPWIVPAGRVIQDLPPEEVAKATEGARRHAMLEPKEADKVKTAADEAATMLRYWMAHAINHSENIQIQSTRWREEMQKKSRQWKIAAMIAGASIVLLGAILSLTSVLKRKRGPSRFPSQLRQPRLGAPHAGGNHALADLGPPLP